MADKKAANKVTKAEAELTCPWCDYSNDDVTKGELHTPEPSRLVDSNSSGKVQCATCGKLWKKEDLGKPWTLGLERGPKWMREEAARQLKA